MKKTLAALLAAALLLSLCACGSSGSSSNSGSSFTTGSGDIQAKDFELQSGTMTISEPNFGEITAVTVSPIEDVVLELPEYDFREITSVMPYEIEDIVLELPEYHFKEITWTEVTLNVPEVDYEISRERISSAYTDTYTVPDLQVETPAYEDEALEQVFVSVAANLPAEDQQQLADMEDTEIAQVAALQLNLAEQLVEAFKEAGITVAIDPMTGAIPIDATLLFDTEKYDLKIEGKAALKAVFTVIAPVLARPEFKNALSSILVEGHTDPTGDYAYNQLLSERRAQAVYDFLLSDECGLAERDLLEGLLTTVGRSCDNPVYAADGQVDLAASRRVEIRFLPDLG